jgi:hypothetical protein
VGWLAVALVIDVVMALLYASFRVRLTVQGRGEPDGFWALAGGAELGPLALSGLGARGIEAKAQVHLFGKKLATRQRRRRARQPAAISESVSETLDGARARYDQISRWFDPLDLGSFLIRERRRLAFEQMRLELDYSFVDIATTGQLLGAIYAVSALLPASVVVLQNPSWESVDRAAISGSGAIRVFPVLLLVDAAWFLIRNTKLRRSIHRRGAREAT